MITVVAEFGMSPLPKQLEKGNKTPYVLLNRSRRFSLLSITNGEEKPL